VFVDQNRDGQQNDGDDGIGGVVVQLMSGTTLLGTTVSDGDGFYQFSSANVRTMLASTSYTLRIDVTQPAIATFGYTPAQRNWGPDDSLDNDALLNGTNYDIIDAKTGDDGSFRNVFDFGFEPTDASSTIGGVVWLDINGNAIRDTDEPVSVFVLISSCWFW
jgi:serine-aspartate repeat-containing protein C/D/E